MIEEMVNRFLRWPLPDSVCSDLCATKQGYPNRIGTNLLTAVEARAMLEFVLDTTSAPGNRDGAINAGSGNGADRKSDLPPPVLVVSRPRIVCLVGSSKFKYSFERVAFEESMAGHIVLTPVWVDDDGLVDRKPALRELHRAKIKMADIVLVVNFNGYIGSDSHEEIAYAKSLGKDIVFMDDGDL